MAFKINKVKRTLNGYPPFVIMGTPKIGKTTLFTEIVEYVYKDIEKGVIVSMGKEDGLEALDGVPYEKARVWSKKLGKDEEHLPEEDWTRGFVQIVDDLVDNKDSLGFEAVLVDTMDEGFGLADKHTVLTSNKIEKSSKDGKIATSVDGAMKGFGKGRKYSQEIFSEQIHRLSRAGYAVFITGHTKVKEEFDALSDTKYKKFTCSLNSDYYNSVANHAQMIVTIVNENEYDEIGGKRDDDKVKSIISSSRRMMYFRDNGFVDAGGRFTSLPEKLELSAENFMKAFDSAVEGSIKKKKTKKEVEADLAEEKERIVADSKVAKVEEEDIKEKYKDKDFDELLSETTSLIKELVSVEEGKTIVKEAFSKFKVAKVSSLKTLEYKELENLLAELSK